MDLRIASFNIRNSHGTQWEHLWWRRRRTVLDVMLGLDADVIGIQEAHRGQYRWLNRQLGGPWHGRGVGRTNGRGRGEQCPILARRPAVVIEATETRWFGPAPNTPGTKLPGATFPRIATMVRARLANLDRVVVIVNVHLDEHLGANRVAAAGQLLGWIAEWDAPTVVVGDFNAELGSDELSVLLDAGLRSALPPGAGGTNHDFTGSTDGSQIDHILIDRHWRVLGARIDTTQFRNQLPSDHWPVVADLAIDGRAEKDGKR